MSMTPLTKEAGGDREREETTPSTARRAILQVPHLRRSTGLTYVAAGHCSPVGWDTESDIRRVLFKCIQSGGDNTVAFLSTHRA